MTLRPKRATRSPSTQTRIPAYSPFLLLPLRHILTSITRLIPQWVIKRLLRLGHLPKAVTEPDIQHARENAFISKTPFRVTRSGGSNILELSSSNHCIILYLPPIGITSTKSSEIFEALLISSHRRSWSQLLKALLDSSLSGLVDSQALAQRRTARVSTPF